MVRLMRSWMLLLPKKRRLVAVLTPGLWRKDVGAPVPIVGHGGTVLLTPRAKLALILLHSLLVLPKMVLLRLLQNGRRAARLPVAT